MRKFDKDMEIAKAALKETTVEYAVMMEKRWADIRVLDTEGLYHKNEFRRSFIRQDLDRLTKEFRKLAKAAGDDERYER